MYSLRTSSASGALPARPCELGRAARALWPDGPPRRLFAWSPAAVDQHCHRAATAGSGCAGSRDDSSLQLVSLSALGLGLRRPSSVCRLGAPALRRPRREQRSVLRAAAAACWRGGSRTSEVRRAPPAPRSSEDPRYPLRRSRTCPCARARGGPGGTERATTVGTDGDRGTTVLELANHGTRAQGDFDFPTESTPAHDVGRTEKLTENSSAPR